MRGWCWPPGGDGVTAHLSLLALVGASPGAAVWRVGWRLASSLRVTLTAGRGGPRAPHCCVHQSSDRDWTPSRVPLGAVGPIPRKASGSKVPEPTPPPGSDHGDFHTFPVTSWPQAASLRSLAFLAPYTCHLFHSGLIALPRDRFFHLSLFGPGKWLPSKPKTRRGKTPSVTHQGSVPFPGLGSPCPEME